jgi:hypothetical protein
MTAAKHDQPFWVQWWNLCPGRKVQH